MGSLPGVAGDAIGTSRSDDHKQGIASKSFIPRNQFSWQQIAVAALLPMVQSALEKCP
jgi:hypothetical protein